MKPKTIAIASDHRGFQLKQNLVQELSQRGYLLKDFGTDSTDSCDYPDFCLKASLAVQTGEVDRGIVICHTGTGMSICANKVKGVRASLCATVDAARFAREHNDANVLALGAGFTPPDLALKICEVWLQTEFEGGRHERRVKRISDIEKLK